MSPSNHEPKSAGQEMPVAAEQPCKFSAALGQLGSDTACARIVGKADLYLDLAIMGWARA